MTGEEMWGGTVETNERSERKVRSEGRVWRSKKVGAGMGK